MQLPIPTPEKKTGQSLDIVKAELIHQQLANQIVEETPTTEISLIDIGAGDATSTTDLITKIQTKGKRIKQTATLDADLTIFPKMIQTQLDQKNIDVINVLTQDIEALYNFLAISNGIYDIATIQLVLHQIQSTNEVTYLLHLAQRTLSDTGSLFIVSLNNKYLTYLAKNYPDKFNMYSKDEQGISGQYSFDTAGHIKIFNRSLDNTAGLLMGMGFDAISAVPIYPDALQGRNLRYKDLTDHEIPMFQILHMKKNPDLFVSSSICSVNRVTASKNPNWISIYTHDNTNIEVPKFTGYDEVDEGDYVCILNTKHPQIEGSIFHYWVKKPDGKLISSQLIVKNVK